MAPPLPPRARERAVRRWRARRAGPESVAKFQVSFNLIVCSVEQVLDLLCDLHGLDYAIEDEGVRVFQRR